MMTLNYINHLAKLNTLTPEAKRHHFPPYACGSNGTANCDIS